MSIDQVQAFTGEDHGVDLVFALLVHGVGDESQLLADLLEGVSIDAVLADRVREQARREADLDGRLNLVASQDPQLDSGLANVLDHVCDLVL